MPPVVGGSNKSAAVRQRRAAVARLNAARAAWSASCSVSLASGTDFPEDFLGQPANPPSSGVDESLALRSVGYRADRLRRGGSRGASAPDPEILRQDA